VKGENFTASPLQEKGQEPVILDRDWGGEFGEKGKNALQITLTLLRKTRHDPRRPPRKKLREQG